MSDDAKKIFLQLIAVLKERFDTYHDGRTNVIHLHRRTPALDESTDAKSILKGLRIGAGDFGLYALVSSKVGFWGPTNSVLNELKRTYADKWAMFLLDGSPTIGYFYTPPDVDISLSGWDTNKTGESYKIDGSRLGHCRRTIGTDSFWHLLSEAGAIWE